MVELLLLQGMALRLLSLSALLGVITAAVISMGLVSTQSPADLEAEDTILTVYGER